MVKAFFASREEREGKRIEELFGEDFLGSKSWLCTGAPCSRSRTGTPRRR